MARPGNLNGQKREGLAHVLRALCVREDYARLRSGCEVMLNRYAKEGGIREAEFIRDTLDGRPKQAIDLQGDNGNALTSLQVLFVDAATRIANAQAARIEQQQAVLIESEPALRINEAIEQRPAETPKQSDS